MEHINGMRFMLHQAKEKKEKVKIIFQYPSASKVTLKSGLVLETYEDSFCLDERDDGQSVYSYKFIVEIRPI